jgi:hypothetical protein
VRGLRKSSAEYVDVPDKLLSSTSELKKYFAASYAYVASLKPKPTAKKKRAEDSLVKDEVVERLHPAEKTKRTGGEAFRAPRNLLRPCLTLAKISLPAAV